MAILIVGGVTVSLASGADQSETDDPVGGEFVRMFDGTARSTVRSYKRTWGLTTTALTSGAAATLLAALKTTTLPVACSGDLTGSINAIPRVTGVAPVQVPGGFRSRITFTLAEV